MMRSPLFPARFFAEGLGMDVGGGRDRGLYYAHQVDPWSELWCYGEHPDYDWAYVFRGALEQTSPNTIWAGDFFAVPKGARCDAGQFTFETTAVSGRLILIERTDRTPDHDPFLLPGFRAVFGRPVENQRPGFQGNGLRNLSGLWIGNDGGHYYVNEVPGTGQIVWYGENPAALPDDEAGESGGSQWANIMIGNRTDRTITGRWADVPRGSVDQFGEMELNIIDETHLEITSVTGGFGGRTFERVESGDEGGSVSDITVSIAWNSVDVIDRTERRGGGDEISLHLAVAKMDGATVDLSDLRGSESDLWVRDTRKVASNVSGGDDPVELEEDEAPTYSSTLIPVPGASAGRDEPVIGIAIAGIERDKRRVTNADDWGRLLKSTLDRRLQRNEPLAFESVAGIRHLKFRILGDDYMGYQAMVFSWPELMAVAATGPRDLTFRISGRGGVWEVSATLTVVVPRGDTGCSAIRQ